jgi:hypothetical protein
MKGKHWPRLLALLFVLFLLNGCSSEKPDASEEPAATVPPSSIGSESSHLVRPTPANPEEKVEPTRAISAETVAQLNQTNGGLQTNSGEQDELVHRHRHVVYLMVIVRRYEE